MSTQEEQNDRVIEQLENITKLLRCIFDLMEEQKEEVKQ